LLILGAYHKFNFLTKKDPESKKAGNVLSLFKSGIFISPLRRWARGAAGSKNLVILVLSFHRLVNGLVPTAFFLAPILYFFADKIQDNNAKNNQKNARVYWEHCQPPFCGWPNPQDIFYLK
jgi:hypothetical protein